MTITQVGPKVIRRYANRKLYDTAESKYITLKQIVADIRSGADIQVVDNESKQDITAATLLAAIVETEDGTTQTGTLVNILRAGSLENYLPGYKGQGVV